MATTVPLATADGASVEAHVWAEQLQLEADDVEVLVRHTDGWRVDEPAVVRRGGLVYVGAAGLPVWDHVVGRVTGLAASSSTTEEFHRGGTTVVLDHEALSVERRPAGTTRRGH